MPRALEQTIHAVGQQGVPARLLFTDWRSQIVTLFNSSTAKYEFGMHLMREFNRRAKIAGFEDLMFTPYNSGFAFTGQTIAAIGGGGGGGGIPITQEWVESGSSGNAWTSFVADGTGGFTATSDGASVAIIPEDVSGLDGDTVQFNFNIDTLSAGSLTFSVDESGVVADDAVDNGVVTKVTGGTRSGAQAIFTSTGVKVVVIRTKKTNGLNALRPKFKSTDSGQNIVISGFEAIGGQVADYWTGAIYGYDFNYRYFLDDNLVDDTDLAFVRTSSISTIGDLGAGIIPKLGDGCFYNSGGLFTNLANVASVSYDMEPAIDLADWTENQATAEVVTFGGYSNVLKVTCGAPTSGHKGVGVAFGAATYANYRAEIYVPSSNTNVDGVYSFKSISSTLRNEIPTPDTWKKVSWQATSGPSSLYFMGSDNGATTGIAFGGDVFYIRLLKIVETNQGGAAGTGHMGLHTTYPDFSVSMWVRPRSGSMGATKFALAQCNTATTSTSERNLAIGKSSLDKWYAGVRNTVGGFPNVSGGSVVVDTYAHLYVSVKQGEYLRFWADGVYLGETDLTGMTMYTPTSVVTRLGGVGNVYWAGEIDQLLVYDYAGGQPDVDYLFAGGDGIETSLIQATLSLSTNAVTDFADLIAAWSLAPNIGDNQSGTWAFYGGSPLPEDDIMMILWQGSFGQNQTEINDKRNQIIQADATAGDDSFVYALKDRTGRDAHLAVLHGDTTANTSPPFMIENNALEERQSFRFSNARGLGPKSAVPFQIAAGKKLSGYFLINLHSLPSANPARIFDSSNTAGGGYSLILDASGSNLVMHFYAYQSASTSVHLHAHAVLDLPITEAGWAVFSWDINGSSSMGASDITFYLNGVEQTLTLDVDTTGTYGDGARTPKIGMDGENSVGSRFADFSIGSILIFNKTTGGFHTSATRNSIVATMMHTHGLDDTLSEYEPIVRTSDVTAAGGTIQAIYSLQRRVPAYTGPIAEVYNGSTTVDCYDQTDIWEHDLAGTGTLEISKWYDQSGNARHAVPLARATPVNSKLHFDYEIKQYVVRCDAAGMGFGNATAISPIFVAGVLRYGTVQNNNPWWTGAANQFWGGIVQHIGTEAGGIRTTDPNYDEYDFGAAANWTVNGAVSRKFTQTDQKNTWQSFGVLAASAKNYSSGVQLLDNGQLAGRKFYGHCAELIIYSAAPTRATLDADLGATYGPYDGGGDFIPIV